MSQDNIPAIVVKVDNPYVINKVYLENSSFIIKTGFQGPPGIPGENGSLMAMTDLDTSELENGAVIVFDSSLDKFKTTNLLENQIINAGHY